MRNALTIRTLSLSVVPVLAALIASGALPAVAQSIDFKADIPKAPAEVKVFKLAPSKPPLAFVNEALRQSKLPPLSARDKALVTRDDRFKDDPELVRAYVDTASGDTYLTPSTADLVAGPARELSNEAALDIARKAFSDETFIPHDATELRLARPIPVLGGADSAPTKQAQPSLRTTGRVAPHTLMVMVPALRYAGGLPVYGRGSRAVITVAADGTVVGAVRRWRTASEGDTVKSEVSADQVHDDILRQLKGKVPDGASAVVDRVELAYYDRNADFLQPVYHFEAEIAQRDSKSKSAPIRIEGFVPLIRPREAIPDLAGKAQGDGPGEAPRPKVSALSALSPDDDAKLRAQIGGAGTADDFTLGEYANQDWPNDGGYVDMSYSFLGGLQDKTSQVNRTQWYVAHNWEVAGPESRYFMNAVNVAYTVPHGDWLLNTTLRNDAEFWYVQNIGTGGNPGFGHAAGGVLATWIIMSCEVIPSYYDRQHEANGSGNGNTAFDAWWPVFQGMHNAIAFRTIMYYPDDSLQNGFGEDAATGGDVITAWFQEIAANEGGRGSYSSTHLTGGINVAYDRGSAIVDGRDVGHSIFHVTAQSASSTLWNFWMGD